MVFNAQAVKVCTVLRTVYGAQSSIRPILPALPIQRSNFGHSATPQKEEMEAFKALTAAGSASKADRAPEAKLSWLSSGEKREDAKNQGDEMTPPSPQLTSG